MHEWWVGVGMAWKGHVTYFFSFTIEQQWDPPWMMAHEYLPHHHQDEVMIQISARVSLISLTLLFFYIKQSTKKIAVVPSQIKQKHKQHEASWIKFIILICYYLGLNIFFPRFGHFFVFVIFFLINVFFFSKIK